MINELKQQAKSLPLSPGVYLMKDQSGTIIYIGKAKKLKERVGSYFIKNSQHSTKVKRMLLHLASFEVILVDTELDALLLECHLIQEHRPLYNRQMNAFERYAYFNLFDKTEQVKLTITSYPESDYSFGPYTVYKKLPMLKEILEKTYLLNPDDSWHRLFSQKSTPVPKKIVMQELLLAFTGNPAPVEQRIEKHMLAAAEQMHFIQAAQWRDERQLLQLFFQKHAQLLLSPISQKEWHALWLPVENGQKCYWIYQGLVIAEKYFPKRITTSEAKLKEKALKLLPNRPQPIAAFSKKQIDLINIMYLYLQQHQECILLSLGCF